jgi:hypothetical protein
MSPGSGGRRCSADAVLWRPCLPDVAREEQGRSREPRLTRSPALPVGQIVERGKDVDDFNPARPPNAQNRYVA